MHLIMKSSFKYILSPLGIVLVAALSVMQMSCGEKDSFNDIVSSDKAQPGPVTKVEVNNYAGGALISYDLPAAENLLYILAEYKINDRVTRQTKASYYADTIRVDGFEKEQPYEVTLYAVSRAEVRSEPVTVTVNPGKPAYLDAYTTVAMERDFGGVNITVHNQYKQAIGVIVITDNPTEGIMTPVEQYYTQLEYVNFSVRGFDTTAHNFGVYITDRWGNISDTLLETIHPIYETLVPKSGFSEYRLSSDSPLGATGLGWNTTHLWDGSTGEPGWHTESGTGKQLQVCTFDMGATVKLSRYKIWERGEGYGNDYSYGHGNPKTWTLWGSNVAAPQDADLPISSEPGTVVGDWINLGNFDCPPPPSGNPPGQTNAQDLAFVQAGFEFNVPLTAPKVRYIRFAVSSTWGNTDFAHVLELSFWGDTN